MLEPFVLVSLSGRVDDMCSSRLPSALIEHSRDDNFVENVACVKKCLGCGFGEFSEAESSLLGGDEGAGSVDV